MSHGIRDVGIVMTVAACAVLSFAVWLAQPMPGAHPTFGDFKTSSRPSSRMVDDHGYEVNSGTSARTSSATQPAAEIDYNDTRSDRD